jgi:putative FmdB family regulatory protein
MPTYEYACTACGHRLEAVQKFSDKPLKKCPECGKALRKVYGAVGIVLKGSGFYKTDSRATTSAGAGGNGAASSSESSSSSSDSSSSDSSSSKDSGSKSEGASTTSDSSSTSTSTKTESAKPAASTAAKS